MKKNRRAFLIFMAPSFLGVAVFVIIPFMDVFRRSFTTAVTGKFTGTANYKTIFENQAFDGRYKYFSVYAGMHTAACSDWVFDCAASKQI